MGDGGDTWTMRDETRFIKGLGRHSLPGRARDSRFDRRTLLLAYLRSTYKKKEWGSVDKKACRQIARGEL